MAHTTEQITKEIKADLTKRGLTIKDAGEMLGKSLAAMSGLLSGKFPISRKTAQLLSDAFGYNVNYMLTGEGDLFGDDSPKPRQDGFWIPIEFKNILEKLTDTVALQERQLAQLNGVRIDTSNGWNSFSTLMTTKK